MNGEPVRLFVRTSLAIYRLSRISFMRDLCHDQLIVTHSREFCNR